MDGCVGGGGGGGGDMVIGSPPRTCFGALF